jgi:hypothetical protein
MYQTEKGLSGRDMSKGWKAHEFLRKYLKLSLKGWKAQEKIGRCGGTGCCQLSAPSQLEAGR